MPQDEPYHIVVDSGERSETVDQVRDMARKMLVEAVDKLFEIGTNPAARDTDRVMALKEVIRFAEGAKPGDTKRILKHLDPKVRNKLAKLGLQKDENPPNRGNLLPDEAQEQRLGSGAAPGDGRESEPERAGGLGPEGSDGAKASNASE